MTVIITLVRYYQWRQAVSTNQPVGYYQYAENYTARFLPESQNTDLLINTWRQ